MRVRAFDLVPAEENAAFWRAYRERIHVQPYGPSSPLERFLHDAGERVKLVVGRKDEILCAPYTTALLPHFCNIHEFTAHGDIGCAVLDILTPPYNSRYDIYIYQ
jgi:hypothetical protein